MEANVLSKKDIQGFQRFIWRYYRSRGRRFSWRNFPDPYQVLISEFMLQQTQTERVESKIHEFLIAFPRIENLAQASLSEVLQLWVGLGYNRRGVNLHKTAQKIVEEFDGIVPSEPDVLRQFPGIGAYTSCAIPTFSYNVPTVFIETNIRRVFIHHFTDPTEEEVSEKFLLSLVAQTLDPTNSREWYYGLMDYGAELKGLLGNSNHRSKIYKKQSPFEGSLRQVRGAVLRVLAKEGSQPSHRTLSSLKKSLGDHIDYSRLLRAARALEKDGILEVSEAEDGAYLFTIVRG